MRTQPDLADLSVVCAIVLNWNGWRDTRVCLESLFALGGTPMRIVVCDNGSSDDSVPELERFLRERPAGHDGSVVSVDLLRLPRNLGFAGGMNAGIAWARERWAPRGFWLLNNDVQAQPGALDALVAAHDSVPDAGICGSVLLDWDAPQRIQAVAGIFRRWLGVGWHATALPEDGSAITFSVDYPVGASMYVAARYLDEVGPMDPGYFLYCEEMDWAERGRRHGLRPLVAVQSRLRHKEGASTGSRGGVRHKSLLSERYGVTSRLRVTRKFWPRWLPVVWASLLLVIADRLVHGEFERARLVLRLMFSPSQWLLARPAAVHAPAASLRIEPVFVAADRRSFFEGCALPQWQELARLSSEMAQAHPKGAFRLRRFCLCCGAPTRMRMDWRHAWPDANGKATPNWRERLVCSGCGMNNRQRLVARLVQQAAAQRERPRIYLMEQVTPIFEWVRRLPSVEVHGSEYLGFEYRGGEQVRGIRHEDVMNLSWPDASFDLIVSNDVMEHIPDPARALRECFRVLKPGGSMLATFPFHVDHAETVVRAKVVGNEVEHLLPPAYHGNPLSADGSLVFRDFGWDLLDDMRAAGFSPAVCEAYGSDEFGHLGTGLLVFRLTRPQRMA